MSISKISRKFCQLGQGMTEYLIVVALIAGVGITVVGFLGGSVNNQLAAVAKKVAGDPGTTETANAGTEAGKASTAAGSKTLKDFAQ